MKIDLAAILELKKPKSFDELINLATEHLEEQLKNFPIFDYVEHEYKQHLKTCDVFIVGGADRVCPCPQEAVENALYVRINGHIERQGGKCDVLYHTCIAEPDILSLVTRSIVSRNALFAFLNLVDSNYEIGKTNIPKYARFIRDMRNLRSLCEIGFFAQGTWLEKNPYGPQYEWLNDLHKKYDCKFFTGNVAIAHVLRYAEHKVEIASMTAFVERTKGSLEGKVESHEVRGNIQFLRDIESDPRVYFSDELKRSLDEYDAS